MSKQKISYSCSSCSYKSIKWLGCCPDCNTWNSFTEIKTAPSLGSFGASKTGNNSATMHHLSDISYTPKKRMLTGIGEWDRVMGGGIMPSSLIVLTGDPGIGKSTLLLQVCDQLAKQHTVYYFSTEESPEQVMQRAQRLNCSSEKLLFSDKAELEIIIATAHECKPDVLIIDSIQNCYISGAQTTPGSVAQLRETTFQLMRLAKENNITIIVTGHITKEGIIAGPKTLEHMVDAVFYLQSEDRWQTRMLRAVKNRFGTINELGFFEMDTTGLKQVADINKHLISELNNAAGSVLVSVIEGSRPLLLELQALTIESKMGIPQRVVSGLDHKQVVLIAAILQKYLHIKLNTHDIFFKISGGFAIKSSSTDLGIALAMLSSYFQQSLPEKSIALGEISLTGQIKPINQINLLVKEAEKFGIERLLVANSQKIEKSSAKIYRFSNVYELLALFSEK